MEADEERIKLEKLAEELALQEDDDAQDYLQEVSILRQKKSAIQLVKIRSLFSSPPERCTTVWTRLELTRPSSRPATS